jgi:hypothetical protein
VRTDHGCVLARYPECRRRPTPLVASIRGVLSSNRRHHYTRRGFWSECELGLVETSNSLRPSPPAQASPQAIPRSSSGASSTRGSSHKSSRLRHHGGVGLSSSSPRTDEEVLSLPRYCDEKVANRDIRVWHGATEKGSLNDGKIQNPLGRDRRSCRYRSFAKLMYLLAIDILGGPCTPKTTIIF